MEGRDTSGGRAPLRVLFLAQFDFHGPAELQAAVFARELGARGHEVMFSLGGEAGSADRQGLFPSHRPLIHAHRFAGPRLRAEDLRAARSFAPSLIHTLNPRSPTIRAAAQLAEAVGAPVCVHFGDD
jgi:hypothetical protein